MFLCLQKEEHSGTLPHLQMLDELREQDVDAN
jgi:hypothetical protein